MVVAIGILIGVVGIVQGSTPANYVPASFAGVRAVPYDISQITPYECLGQGVSTLITGSGGNIKGTKGNDLILGSSAKGSLAGQQGNDCLVGGAGADSLDGGPGTDVYIGNSLATFKRCAVIIRR
ncbi:MAG: hypothetical protein O2919_00975 [Chloroflexi bacterium]|nr:hypothetical protein [Chloroflexota bacterium]